MNGFRGGFFQDIQRVAVDGEVFHFVRRFGVRGAVGFAFKVVDPLPLDGFADEFVGVAFQILQGGVDFPVALEHQQAAQGLHRHFRVGVLGDSDEGGNGPPASHSPDGGGGLAADHRVRVPAGEGLQRAEIIHIAQLSQIDDGELPDFVVGMLQQGQEFLPVKSGGQAAELIQPPQRRTAAVDGNGRPPRRRGRNRRSGGDSLHVGHGAIVL